MWKVFIIVCVTAVTAGINAETLVYRYKLKGVELYRESKDKAYKNKGVSERGYVAVEYDLSSDEFQSVTLYKDIKKEKRYTVEEFLSENVKVKRETTEKGLSMVITDNKATIKGEVKSGVKITDNHYIIASRLRGYSSWNSIYESGAESIGSGRITLALDKRKTIEAYNCPEGEFAEKVLKYEGYKLKEADSELTQNRDTFNNVDINGGTIDNVNIGLKSGSVVNGVFKTLVVGPVDNDYMFPYNRGAMGEVLMSNGDSTTKWESISTIVDSAPAPWNGSIDDAVRDTAKNNLGLHKVASSGSYNDLTDKPAAFPGFGTTGKTACAGDDNRLFNSRAWNGTFTNDKEKKVAEEMINSFITTESGKAKLDAIDAELIALTGKSLKTVMNNIYADPKTSLGSVMSRNQCDERYLNSDACLNEYLQRTDQTDAQKLANLARMRNNVGLGGFETEYETDAGGNIIHDPIGGVFVPRKAGSKVTTALTMEGRTTLGDDAADTVTINGNMAFADAGQVRGALSTYSIAESQAAFLDEGANLADLNDMIAARNNLSVYAKSETYTKAESQATFLDTGANLADLNDMIAARNNLSVYARSETYTKAESQATFLDTGANLGDVNNAGACRTNLNVLSTGENDGRYLNAASNLGDLFNAGTARGNLGLAALATKNNISTSDCDGSFGGWSTTNDPALARQRLGVVPSTEGLTVDEPGGWGFMNSNAYGWGFVLKDDNNRKFGIFLGHRNSSSGTVAWPAQFDGLYLKSIQLTGYSTDGDLPGTGPCLTGFDVPNKTFTYNSGSSCERVSFVLYFCSEQGSDFNVW